MGNGTGGACQDLAADPVKSKLTYVTHSRPYGWTHRSSRVHKKQTFAGPKSCPTHQGSRAADHLALRVVLRAVARALELVLSLQT